MELRRISIREMGFRGILVEYIVKIEKVWGWFGIKHYKDGFHFKKVVYMYMGFSAIIIRGILNLTKKGFDQKSWDSLDSTGVCGNKTKYDVLWNSEYEQRILCQIDRVL